MALQNRKSVMAIKKEVVESVPVSPTSGSNDYIPLQEGFSMEPSFDTLENAELTGSIGIAKPVLGLENPSASVSHYVKHSGVEGSEPNFGLLFEALLGAKDVNATEYDTIGGSIGGSSTVQGKVVVDTGEGANFQIGQGLLIKSSGGYKIRNVESISSDDLKLSFNIDHNPTSGTNLGKAVMYLPANENHPTFSTWLYRANGGAVEMMAGSRVISATINANAGEFVNADFSFEGVEYYFNPIEITASSKFIDFDDGSVQVANVAEGFYKDPHDLAAALQIAMDSVSSDNITVSYSDSTGKFTIASDGASLELLWDSGANAANTIGEKIGFSIAADDTGVLTYTSDSAVILAAPQIPTYDPTSPLVAKANEVLLGDFNDYGCIGASSVTINASNTKADLLDLCAVSGKEGSLIAGREFSIDIVARLSQYDADKFKRFRQGLKTPFTYNCGEKLGGNWVAGKCINFYTPSATISSFALGDDNGVITLEMSLTCFVQDGLNEFFVNFL
jgi:hypothetical protein